MGELGPVSKDISIRLASRVGCFQKRARAMDDHAGEGAAVGATGNQKSVPRLKKSVSAHPDRTQPLRAWKGIATPFGVERLPRRLQHATFGTLRKAFVAVAK